MMLTAGAALSTLTRQGPTDLSDVAATMQRLRAQELWQQAQARNTREFRDFPLDSCSVPGHVGAAAFAAFIAPALTAAQGLTAPPGWLLDVGCGPQPLPAYLEGYPLRLVRGIDPLAPTAGPHPFVFVQGNAETLPWPDGHFAVVVAATSLDHVVDPLRVLDEIRRVLRPGGHFLFWGTLWPDAVPYDVTNPPSMMADACHVYHLGPWFERACLERFTLARTGEGPGAGTFWALQRPADDF